MRATVQRRPIGAIHPLHAALVACAVPPFLGGLLSDMAYSGSYEIQWANFAAWLITGGMVFTGLVLVWALVDLVRHTPKGWRLAYLLVLLATFVLGLINAFVHAKDAWATMPEGLVLSVVVTVLALLAAWIGFSRLYRLGGDHEVR